MTTTKTKGSNSKVTGRLIGLAIELPPVFYVALTGTVPGLIRAWLIAWLSLWLVVTVVSAARAQTGGAA